MADENVKIADVLVTLGNLETFKTENDKLTDSKIATEIGKLDKADSAVAGEFVTAVSEEDGVVTVSRAALQASDIPEITLDKITDAGTAAAADVAVTEIGTEGEVADALPTVAQVKKYVTDSVADLEGATHFIGVKDALPETAESGDIVIVGVKEYIYDGAKWNELGDETIYVTKTTTIAGVDLENDITKEELLTALNVEDDADVNILEGVQVNGTDLTIDENKKVNVTVTTGTDNGTIAVNGADVAVQGLGTAAYEDVDVFDAAGTATTEIGKLNATVSTVTAENPTPIVNVEVVETAGVLTSVTANIKDETFDAYGDAAQALIDAKAYADGKYVTATTTQIENLFKAQA